MTAILFDGLDGFFLFKRSMAKKYFSKIFFPYRRIHGQKPIERIEGDRRLGQPLGRGAAIKTELVRFGFSIIVVKFRK